MNRPIRPLGEQIIIRTIPQDSVGSILIPDSARRITMMPDGKPMEAVHYVEAEVIAVGPGKRMKTDPQLFDDLVHALTDWNASDADRPFFYDLLAATEDILRRAKGQHPRIPALVKPGDRILYHPSVQRFDRDITAVMSNGNDSGSKYFMIREDSVLAVIER